MKITFNIRHLEKKSVHLQGEVTAVELEIEGLDPLIKVPNPLLYDIEVQQIENEILAQGRLRLDLQCTCARCLEEFWMPLELNEWACLLPLEGDDAIRVDNDLVDLTPYVREDTVLGFPQHPLCKAECGGLKWAPQKETEKEQGSVPKNKTKSVWTVLDTLKLE